MATFLINLITSAVAMGTVFLYGCVGETLIEKGGNLNLGIPGVMCLGALGGGVGVTLYYMIFENEIWFFLILFSLVFTMIFAMLGGLIYAFLTVTLKANQNVTGLVLTTFGVGVMKFFGKNFNLITFSQSSAVFKRFFVGYEALGDFGKVFLSHGFYVYLSIILAVLVSIFLNKTKTGLFLRSVGESPQTADAQGINVDKYKYSAILIGCAIAGLGGTYYVFDRFGGQGFSDAAIDAFGWLAVALVIFSTWRPGIGILGSILFGGLYVLPYCIEISKSQIKLFAMLPYIITVLVLILTSMFDAKNSQPPNSLGINYFREER